jgi:hypothetical protein
MVNFFGERYSDLADQEVIHLYEIRIFTHEKPPLDPSERLYFSSHRHILLLLLF